MSDSDRIGDLEAVVRTLTRRVSELEALLGFRSGSAAELGSSPSATIAPPSAVARETGSGLRGPPPVPDSRPPERRSSATTTLNLEAVIGRYGALALATITILAAVGSFLAWSIAHGLLGPWLRILIGTLAAGLLAFIGWRLRLRGTRQFGNVLLALALAALHVVAWALGPGLALVPTAVALAVAALASAALCLFAIRESDDDLLAVGFGGAYLASFVTGGRPESPSLSFAIYGAVVFGAGVLATNGRPSRMTFRVISAGLILFALTLLYAPDANGNPSLLAPFFTLAASLVVIVIGTRVAWRDFLRTTLAMSSIVSIAIASRYVHSTSFATWPELLAIVIATFIVWASTFAFPSAPGRSGVTRASAPALALFDYTLLPLLLLLAAVSSLPPDSKVRMAALCALWAAVTGFLAHRSREGTALDFYAGATCIELAAVPLALWSDRPEFFIPGLAAIASAFGYAATRYRSRVPQTAALAVTAMAFTWSLSYFADLEPFSSFPFSTRQSLAAAATVAAAFLIVRWNRERLPRLAAAGPWILGFLWGAVELGRAFSRDASAFLLVAYFAASGVTVLALGTKRGNPRVRQAGLGLAVMAGLKALFGAGQTQSILARVGIYLVAGAYLMVVAYKYRKAQPT